MDYEQWKKDLLLWTEFTDISRTKMAIAVHLSLTGRARATSELSMDELKNEDGIDNLLKKLDRVFMQDENWRCFNNYLAFENYRRAEGDSIDQYLSEFNRRHYKLKECGVQLSDAVVACRLIKSCNLSEVHFQLALSTTPKMTHDDMRNTLKRLFAEGGGGISNVGSGSQPVLLEVKNEPLAVNDAYYGEQHYGRRGSYRGMRRAHNGRNPIGRDGKVTTCHICSSTMHWSRSCPQRYKKDFHSDKEEECHVTLMASNEPSEGISSLMGESIGSMVLDSGCSRTVCGIIWLFHGNFE